MRYGLGIGNQGWKRLLLALGVSLATIVGAACTGDENEDGAEPQQVFDLKQDDVGTCLKFDDTVGSEIDKLPVVPTCEVEHSHEIFATAELDAEEFPVYPGFEALEAAAQARCLGAFEDYVGVSPFDSELFFSWIVPTLTSWDQENDRQIICVIGNGNGEPMFESVEGSER